MVHPLLSLITSYQATVFRILLFATLLIMRRTQCRAQAPLSFDTYNVSGYISIMIKSFRHKGLEHFFTTGSKRGIKPGQAVRLKQILFRLRFAEKIGDMSFPGSDLHPLKGKLKGHWAVKASGNWRLIFRFEGGHVLEVDYGDYH